MVRYRLFAFLSLAAVALCSAAASVAAFVERAVLAVFHTLGEPFAIGQPLSGSAYSGGGAAGIAPSLYHSQRHEAGTSRRAAARNV